MSPDRARMRPFEQLAPWSRALAAARELAHPVTQTEALSLPSALGRTLASPALSRIDVPSADRAAMDGYALRAEEAPESGARLRRAGRVAAGQDAPSELEPGECLEIATGAPIPPGVDAVVPVERTHRDGDTVIFEDAVERGQHVARCGEDLGAGKPIGEAGDRVTAAMLAACAAGGVDTVVVWRRPRVLVAPTGDEVVPVGEPLRPGQVYDSNAAGLIALLSEIGAAPEHAGIVIDEVESLVQLFERPGYDLVVTIGGTSVGRRDLVSDALADAGSVSVHGVAVKPGKPLLLGRVGETPLVGLPGFPTTCMMLGYALLDPLVRRLARNPVARASVSACPGETIHSPGGKHHLLPVSLRDGHAYATFRTSSAVSSMARAHGWIEIEADAAAPVRGEPVKVTLF